MKVILRSAINPLFTMAQAVIVLAAMGCAATPPDQPQAEQPPEASSCAVAMNENFQNFVEDQAAGVNKFDAIRDYEFVLSPREGRYDALMAFFVAQGWDAVMEERSGGVYLLQLNAPSVETAHYYEILRGRTDLVDMIEPNRLFYPTQRTPNDPCFSFQWHYQDNEGGVNLPAKWEETIGAEAVVVAVLDTGIARNDDIAAANIVDGYDFISDAANARDGDGRDPDPTDPGDSFQSWHGTHVAGTVGAVASDNARGVAGVAWRVSVLPVRVLGFQGGTTADIADAIRWAAGLPVPGVAANPTPARIINMSLGGQGRCGPAFQSAINDATTVGAVVVVAAGNDASDAAGFAPSSCDNVVTVAASDRLGRLAFYSNFGAAVDITAPGGDNRVDLDGDGVRDGVISIVKDGVEPFNGTSMAAPHVAGVAALMLAEDPSLGPQEILQALQENARPRDAIQCPQPCGAGLLNADFEL